MHLVLFSLRRKATSIITADESESDALDEELEEMIRNEKSFYIFVVCITRVQEAACLTFIDSKKAFDSDGSGHGSLGQPSRVRRNYVIYEKADAEAETKVEEEDKTEGKDKAEEKEKVEEKEKAGEKKAEKKDQAEEKKKAEEREKAKEKENAVEKEKVEGKDKAKAV
ncbi:hypothetical protein RB195_004501 [Necator americanus]|uniref:Uncharacterized protein n=1 Tax=Necator americanus TaxID=51031 RepID=A0ABR1BIB4_NECAM